MYYNMFSENFEYDECTAKGSCSIPPSISALQEVLLLSLRQLAFYILKLRDMGINCADTEEKIVDSLATIITTTDYTDEQFLNIVSKIYSTIIRTKNKYFDLCKESGREARELKSNFDLSPQMNLSQIMSLGEKAFLRKYKKISQDQKNMTDILLSVIKSVALNTAKLLSYSEHSPEAVTEILKGLDLLNHNRTSLERYKKQIKSLASIDIELVEKLGNILSNRFGPVISSEVSHSTTKGKAILVSGENLLELEKILSLTEEKPIDVYTHGNLIVAHAFKRFSDYKSLKGHFGTCNENCILDFATFPGAILLTQNSNTNTEYLYRGRLFTTVALPPQGVIPVKCEDLSEVIKSAEAAKGFAKGQDRPSEIVGFEYDEIVEKLANLAERLNTGEISHLIVIGLSATRRSQKEYFNRLIAKLPEDYYVLSFSVESQRENFLHLNVGNSNPLVLSVLNLLFKDIQISSNNITFFIARCDISSISNIINLSERGAKNIYLTQCPPNLINPAILSTIKSVYNIRTTSSVEVDLLNIMK